MNTDVSMNLFRALIITGELQPQPVLNRGSPQYTKVWIGSVASYDRRITHVKVVVYKCVHRNVYARGELF